MRETRAASRWSQVRPVPLWPSDVQGRLSLQAGRADLQGVSVSSADLGPAQVYEDVRGEAVVLCVTLVNLSWFGGPRGSSGRRPDAGPGITLVPSLCAATCQGRPVPSWACVEPGTSAGDVGASTVPGGHTEKTSAPFVLAWAVGPCPRGQAAYAAETYPLTTLELEVQGPPELRSCPSHAAALGINSPGVSVCLPFPVIGTPASDSAGPP